MTEHGLSELHRLAFEYRNAGSYAQAALAWAELERYMNQDRAKILGLLRGALTAMEVLRDFTEADPIMRHALPGLPYLIDETRKALEIAP